MRHNAGLQHVVELSQASTSKHQPFPFPLPPHTVAPTRRPIAGDGDGDDSVEDEPLAMAAETTETIKKIKCGLEPFIKPRDQVNYIRRVLALHLGACAGYDGPLRHPLALADSSRNVHVTPELSGNFREYIEALQANIAARRRLDELLRSEILEPAVNTITTQLQPPKQQQHQQQQNSLSTAGADLLEERICLLKWHQKLESLHAVRQSLDSLMEKPAAMEGFLDAKHIFQETPAPPENIIDELDDAPVAEEGGDSQFDLTEHIQHMEKTVLRARLQLKQEEQKLREAKERRKAQPQPDVVSNNVRFEALKATRDELIRWIETELGKVSPEYVNKRHQADAATGLERGRAHPHLQQDGPTLSARLDEISSKYAKYVLLRRTLLDLSAHKSKSSLLPPVHFPMTMPSGDNPTPAPAPLPVNFLITPYLNTLVTISAKQRAVLGQRAAVTSALGKESQETCQMLGHLGEESQLLVKYPMKDSLRRRSGIQHEIAMRSSEQPDISERIKPWVFAADSAKISTLETVAETVEGGQVALESSMSLLQDIDVLLGRDEEEVVDEEAAAAEEPVEEDHWPFPRRSGVSARKTVDKRKKESKRGGPQGEGDVWSRLHGNLGLSQG